MISELTCTIVREALDYNPCTGELYWRMERPLAHFASAGMHRAWHRKFAGKPAGSWDADGYRKLSFSGGTYSQHRIIWFHYYGEWPSFEIDHINRDRSDNRIVNLRDAPHSVNMRNRKTPFKPRRGRDVAAGVYQCKRSHSWAARIGISNKQLWLGSYATFEEALAVRRAAEERLDGHLCAVGRAA